MRAIFLLAVPFCLGAQQVADTAYRPAIPKPAYRIGRGPVVLLDEAHTNFHTVAGRYRPFTMLLERDGYVVRSNRAPFSTATLSSARVLVIANALHESNQERWSLPTPSAFTDAEITAVRDWVEKGGSLLLIADHMPFGGAAEKLALAFRVAFGNGFAADSMLRTGAMRFRRSDASLGDHPIIRGRNRTERIDSVTTFTGQAFRLIGGGIPLFTLARNTTLLLPNVAWELSDSTPRIRSDGMLLGAAMEFGRGRVVMLGEAAMISAQLGGPNRTPMGMNVPSAKQNAQFPLNVMRWLSHVY